MRIIAGRLRRRQLVGPRGANVRPTADRLRETLFNVLGPSVSGVRVLDAFAGTGALGLEALSRGASRVVFVESDRAALQTITDNICRCEAESDCEVVRGRFPDAIGPGERFDVILLDPPYEGTPLEAVVASAERMLVPGGVVVLEHSRRRGAPDAAGGLVRGRLLTAGDSALSFYTQAAPAPPATHA